MTQRYSLQREMVHCHAWRWFCCGRHSSSFCTMEESGQSETLYFAEVIFTPSGTLKGPTSSLPMIPAQNMTPPPPCWRRSLVGTWWPSTSHPLLHPSVPSRVARHSSVNKTVWKLVFMYVWAHCNRFCLCSLVRGGRIVGLCTTASSWRILHLEVCGTPEAPAASNTGLLLCNGILAAAFLIRWICLAETFLILPLSAWTHLYSESATNLFKVQWSRLSFREIYNVFIPCPRHCTIWRFSAAERDHFSFPYCLKPVACLIVCKVLLK